MNTFNTIAAMQSGVLVPNPENAFNLMVAYFTGANSPNEVCNVYDKSEWPVNTDDCNYTVTIWQEGKFKHNMQVKTYGGDNLVFLCYLKGLKWLFDNNCYAPYIYISVYTETSYLAGMFTTPNLDGNESLLKFDLRAALDYMLGVYQYYTLITAGRNAVSKGYDVSTDPTEVEYYERIKKDVESTLSFDDSLYAEDGTLDYDTIFCPLADNFYDSLNGQAGTDFSVYLCDETVKDGDILG